MLKLRVFSMNLKISMREVYERGNIFCFRNDEISSVYVRNTINGIDALRKLDYRSAALPGRTRILMRMLMRMGGRKRVGK